MITINRVVLRGQLAADPVLRCSPEGRYTCRVGIVTETSFVDKAGQRQEKRDQHAVVLFGEVAEAVGRGGKAGSDLQIEGELSTRVWTDQRGREHRSTDVVGLVAHFPAQAAAAPVAPAAIAAPVAPTHAQTPPSAPAASMPVGDGRLFGPIEDMKSDLPWAAAR